MVRLQVPDLPQQIQKRSKTMRNVHNENPALAILAGAGVLLAALALLL